MSEYLNYEDLKKTVQHIQASHVMNCTDEAITRYQDMIGHSSIEELTELANTDVYKETFYKVYGIAYGTTEAIRFYLKNSNKIKDLLEEKADIEADRDLYLYQKQEKEKELKETSDNLRAYIQKTDEQAKRAEKAEAQITELEAENQALKAKLYDLITK